MNKEEFVTLSGRVADGIATEQEYRSYNQIYNAFQQGETQWDTIRDNEKLEVKAELQERIGQHVYPPRKNDSRRLWYYGLGVAAALTAIVLNLYFFSGLKRNELPGNASGTAGAIVPGKDKAILTLNSGKHLDLTALKSGQTLKAGNISVIKKQDGRLLYTMNAQSEAGPVTYNTISTPNGGQIQVNLPDGTLVYLNAATQIRVPSNLTADRKVELLEGEAYFEVAHDKSRPFRVITGAQTVKVLGTRFNVNAYAEEGLVKTTLEDGSVSVSVHKNAGETLVIKPGQQAVNTKAGLYAKQVDIYNEIAWKDGMFSFEGQNFERMMRAIGRWYDVDISFDPAIKDLHLSIQAPRSTSINELLKSIETTGDVKFKIEGRRIRVMK